MAGMDSPLEETTQTSAVPAVMREETAWEMWLVWDSGEALREMQLTTVDTASWVVISSTLLGSLYEKVISKVIVKKGSKHLLT